MKLLKEIIDDILSIVYPNHCISCGEVLNAGKDKWLCNNCRCDFEITEHKRCKTCGRIIYHDGKCRICNSERIYFDKGYSVLVYKDSVRNGIMNFKYKGLYRYGKYFGNIMVNYAVQNINMSFDYVTAVPLHSKRFKDRGYNQSKILAKAVAESMNIKYMDLLIRNKNTKAQNSLNRKERKENIRDAFSLRKGMSVENKNILIIDDIYTTGATINECSRVLKKNKAAVVEFFSLSCRSED
ncbi:MAG: ComF family protein [Clostridia bacterium]|nr:ComF family protein [Clostridia bacterium]